MGMDEQSKLTGPPPACVWNGSKKFSTTFLGTQSYGKTFLLRYEPIVGTTAQAILYSSLLYPAFAFYWLCLHPFPSPDIKVLDYAFLSCHVILGTVLSCELFLCSLNSDTELSFEFYYFNLISKDT